MGLRIFKLEEYDHTHERELSKEYVAYQSCTQSMLQVQSPPRPLVSNTLHPHLPLSAIAYNLQNI